MALKLTSFQRDEILASFNRTVEEVTNNLNHISREIKPYFMQYCSSESPYDLSDKCSSLANALDQIDIAKAIIDESTGYIYSAIGVGKSPREEKR
jgi:hypothetical protein